ncbi:MAG: LysR family transcriptional regulator [Paracoccaceae bacterium]|nr:LysR family transcriptional regulator [Paracoccaceae bacterium]
MIRLDALTLKQLRALVSVGQTGSLTATAEAMGLTPPAIHSQIKNLEVALETAMLMRNPATSGLIPSPEGALMIEAACRIDAILSHCATQIVALSRGQIGQVTLGVVSTGKYFAPRLVRILNEACPEIDITLRVGNRGEVISDLDRGAVDLAIMGRPPRMPEVIATALGAHPHGIVLPPDHYLVWQTTVSADMLLRETFLLREEGSGTRILMSRYLDRLAEGRVYKQVEMGSNETIKQAVIAGLGIAFLSLHTVMDEVHHGRLHLLQEGGLPIMRQWYLVHKAATPLSAAAQRLAERIEALNGAFLPQ